MDDYNEGVFAGVIGTLESQGFSGEHLKELLEGVLVNQMNWSSEMVSSAIQEVEWVFYEEE